MSPVIFPRGIIFFRWLDSHDFHSLGFTRDFLDGKVTTENLVLKIQRAHENLMRQSAFVVCEGTGHTGVGSICEVNNAQVAG